MVDDILKFIILYYNCCIFIQISQKFVPMGPIKVILNPNYQYGSIGSDNGLAANSQHVIIWTNDDLMYWSICVSVGLDDLTPQVPVLYI